MNGWAVASTAFLACGVEMVEALTIVLAVGVSKGWRSALSAALVAVVALAAIVVVARPLLIWLEPLPLFHIAVGAVALYFGGTWLRKAILRAAGRKALRDEAAIYARSLDELRRADQREGFLTSFNGVFLEGVEVVFIVLAFGGRDPAALSFATLGAAAALLLVLAVGAIVHRPLARVPENGMKFAVGVMLCAFGVFWIGEGLGISWSFGDAALAVLAASIAVLALGTVRVLRVVGTRT